MKRSDTNERVRSLREIREDYAWNPDIMNNEPEVTNRLKEIIDTKLTLTDKTIILLYADCGSLRILGKRLGVSHMTIRRSVQRIKKIILTEYENHN